MSLMAAAEAASPKTVAAPLDVLARATTGEGEDVRVYVVGTRNGLAQAGLYVERVKDGKTTHRPCNRLADIARAMASTFEDTEGELVEVFG